MKKIVLGLILGLFLSSNVVADTKIIGRCIGIIQGINMEKGSLVEANLKWLRKHGAQLNTLMKISNEQKYCIKAGQALAPCLTKYSNYERELFIEYKTGFINYRNPTNEAHKALMQAACREY